MMLLHERFLYVILLSLGNIDVSKVNTLRCETWLGTVNEPSKSAYLPELILL